MKSSFTARIHARDLRVAVIPLLAFLDGLSVLVAVEKKLALADHPVGPPEFMEDLVEVDDLLHGVGRPRLLAVPEGRIGNEDLLRRIDEDELVVKFDPGDLVVRKNMPVKIRFLDIDERECSSDASALKGFLLRVMVMSLPSY